MRAIAYRQVTAASPSLYAFLDHNYGPDMDRLCIDVLSRGHFTTLVAAEYPSLFNPIRTMKTFNGTRVQHSDPSCHSGVVPVGSSSPVPHHALLAPCLPGPRIVMCHAAPPLSKTMPHLPVSNELHMPVLGFEETPAFDARLPLAADENLNTEDRTCAHVLN